MLINIKKVFFDYFDVILFDQKVNFLDLIIFEEKLKIINHLRYFKTFKNLKHYLNLIEYF